MNYSASEWALTIEQETLLQPCVGSDEAAFQALTWECEAALARKQEGGWAS